MIANISGYKVVAPKKLIRTLKEMSNLNFNKDEKGCEFWTDIPDPITYVAVYKVTYNKHNTIRFQKTNNPF